MLRQEVETILENVTSPCHHGNIRRKEISLPSTLTLDPQQGRKSRGEDSSSPSQPPPYKTLWSLWASSLR